MILSDQTLALLANLGDDTASIALSCRWRGAYAVAYNGKIWVRTSL